MSRPDSGMNRSPRSLTGEVPALQPAWTPTEELHDQRLRARWRRVRPVRRLPRLLPGRVVPPRRPAHRHHPAHDRAGPPARRRGRAAGRRAGQHRPRRVAPAARRHPGAAAAPAAVRRRRRPRGPGPHRRRAAAARRGPHRAAVADADGQAHAARRAPDLPRARLQLHRPRAHRARAGREQRQPRGPRARRPGRHPAVAAALRRVRWSAPEQRAGWPRWRRQRRLQHPDPRPVRRRPDREGAGRRAGPGGGPRGRGRPDPRGALAPHQEQPRAHR